MELAEFHKLSMSALLHAVPPCRGSRERQACTSESNVGTCASRIVQIESALRGEGADPPWTFLRTRGARTRASPGPESARRAVWESFPSRLREGAPSRGVSPLLTPLRKRSTPCPRGSSPPRQQDPRACARAWNRSCSPHQPRRPPRLACRLLMGGQARHPAASAARERVGGSPASVTRRFPSPDPPPPLSESEPYQCD